MWSSGLGWGVRALLALLLGGIGPARAQGTDPPNVIIVFDGSGSIWGNMEGARQSKLVLARDGLRRALSTIGPETRVGLAGFGHRRGDCGDVEVMIQPERLDVDRVMAPLGPYNPRGRGPLTLALREAAKSLSNRNGPRSLVLIHDDADNCQPDLCAAAAELRAAGITAHVVGLAAKPADLAKMACLPQITGGRHLNAQSADQVAPAIEEALRLASAEPAGASPRVAPRTGPTAAPAPIPADAPPGLYLRALLAAKGEPVSWPVQWTVTGEGQPGAVLFEGKAASPMVPVAPGRYIVEARDGTAVARQTVEVADKAPTAIALVMNAGTLLVRAQMQKTGAPLDDAIITINDAGQGAETKKDGPAGPPVVLFKGGEGVATLAAGRYVVHVELGQVRVDRAVVVPAGTQGRIDIAVNAARVQLTASMRDIAETADSPVVFSIVEDDPDAPRGRREVARSAARQAEFILPPGTYYAIARQGGLEAREQLALGPGDAVKRTLSLTPGRLALATKLVGSTQAPSEAVSYRVERVDSSPPEAVTTSRAAPVLLLPAGRYRVEGRYGAMNVRTVREIELKAGVPQQLSLEQQAAALKLRLTGSPGGPALADVFWDIRDEAGRSVWTTGQAEPSATLQAGRYLVRAETPQKRYDRQIELRSGESRQVEVVAD